MAKIYDERKRTWIRVDTSKLNLTVCDDVFCKHCGENVPLTNKDVTHILYVDYNEKIGSTDWHLRCKCPKCGTQITFIHTQYKTTCLQERRNT